MFFIELSCCSLIKLEHLQIANCKFFLSRSNHFTEVQISIGFQHAVGSQLIIIYLLELSSPTNYFFVN
jgi:hypothetical protein